MDSLDNGYTLVVDELNTHLHPLAFRHVTRMFCSSKANPLKAQIIFTTHDPTVTEEDCIGRDQIWLVEKGDDFASRLIPFSDYKTRDERPFRKGYLQGTVRSGAAPGRVADMGKRRGKSPRDTRRRPAHREERERAMIVTEGSKTEPGYFRRLIRELGLTTASVTITGDGGSAPISVVDHAEDLLRHDPDFEYVFLVFDRDRHPTYKAAIAKANKLKPRKAPKKASRCGYSIHSQLRNLVSFPRL